MRSGGPPLPPPTDLNELPAAAVRPAVEGPSLSWDYHEPCPSTPIAAQELQMPEDDVDVRFTRISRALESLIMDAKSVLSSPTPADMDADPAVLPTPPTSASPTRPIPAPLSSRFPTSPLANVTIPNTTTDGDDDINAAAAPTTTNNNGVLITDEQFTVLSGPSILSRQSGPLRTAPRPTTRSVLSGLNPAPVPMPAMPPLRPMTYTSFHVLVCGGARSMLSGYGAFPDDFDARSDFSITPSESPSGYFRVAPTPQACPWPGGSTRDAAAAVAALRVPPHMVPTSHGSRAGTSTGTSTTHSTRDRGERVMDPRSPPKLDNDTTSNGPRFLGLGKRAWAVLIVAAYLFLDSGAFMWSAFLLVSLFMGFRGIWRWIAELAEDIVDLLVNGGSSSTTTTVAVPKKPKTVGAAGNKRSKQHRGSMSNEPGTGKGKSSGSGNGKRRTSKRASAAMRPVE
ncbi:hypothetical protein, variant [Allomyces macrogynus ATCC 38327]|uniref:Uncharacterized protein n=1 Tax=Allomyces macrogynus (strain ATCC 38327) TaxID=578462 RepID=A0A0L0SCV7_ALLM3|nr:hypothetical protein, variant [Allomyces macrogynus ATCC 38327]|eukprot:KNE60316.1 hypothetical protein, variant [Allomyces macrogynus ATCC 38327]